MSPDHKKQLPYRLPHFWAGEGEVVRIHDSILIEIPDMSHDRMSRRQAAWVRFRFILGRKWQRHILLFFAAALISWVIMFATSNDLETLTFVYCTMTLPTLAIFLLLVWDLFMEWCCLIDRPFVHPGEEE